jgi:hypothetical protein
MAGIRASADESYAAGTGDREVAPMAAAQTSVLDDLHSGDDQIVR